MKASIINNQYWDRNGVMIDVVDYDGTVFSTYYWKIKQDANVALSPLADLADQIIALLMSTRAKAILALVENDVEAIELISDPFPVKKEVENNTN